MPSGSQRRPLYLAGLVLRGRQSTPPLVSGRSCFEGSFVSVRSVACAHFVSDIFLQILAAVLQTLAYFLHYFNWRVGVGGWVGGGGIFSNARFKGRW